MDPSICPACTTIQPHDSTRCGWCDWHEPIDGWPVASTRADPWLGRTLTSAFTVAQRLSSADELYRVCDRTGRNFFARFVTIQRLTTRGDWRERARDLMRLRSPHFSQFVDAFEVDEYAIFLSEYIEGERLRDRLRRKGDLGIDTALSIAQQVAVGLDALHRLGVAHTRLEPRAVVLRTAAGRETQATLCSYGAATGVRPKTTCPEYLPPDTFETGGIEQDIFSVGAMLFEMLTGVSPADGQVRDADALALAPSPLRKPSEFHRSLADVPGLDALVGHLTAMEARDARVVALQLEQMRHTAARASRAARERSKSFGGSPQTGTGTAATTSPATSALPDSRRVTLVRFQGEDHTVHARGAVLKLRATSSGARWGPRSTRFDLASQGLTGTLEAISAVQRKIWFGTTEGAVGVFDVDTGRMRILGTIRRNAIAAIDAREHLTVAGGLRGTVLYTVDGVTLLELRGDRPACHVSVSDRAPRFAVGRLDGAVEVYEMHEQRIVQLNEFSLFDLTDIALSADGRQIALSNAEGTVVHDVPSGKYVGNSVPFGDLVETGSLMRPRALESTNGLT